MIFVPYEKFTKFAERTLRYKNDTITKKRKKQEVELAGIHIQSYKFMRVTNGKVSYELHKSYKWQGICANSMEGAPFFFELVNRVCK